MTAFGTLAVRSATQAEESGIQTLGPVPPAMLAAVAGADWAVTAYVAQAPAVVARSAAVRTAGSSGPATATWTATLDVHGVVTAAAVPPLALLAAPASVDGPPAREIAHHAPPPPPTATANATSGMTHRGRTGGASV